MGHCILFGAGDPCLRDFSPKKEDFLIAVDGGLHVLHRLSIRPNLFLGDMDSFGDLPADLPFETLRFPVQKDDTDMGIALSIGFERGYRHFDIYGGGGGRLDHLMANLQNMASMSKKGASLRLIDTHQDIYLLHNNTLTLPPLPKGSTVSIFSHDPISSGVSLSGLLYSLDNATLSATHPLGVSNEILSSTQSAFISVKSGTLSIWVRGNFSKKVPPNNPFKTTWGC